MRYSLRSNNNTKIATHSAQLKQALCEYKFMIDRPKVKILSPASPIKIIHCGECNWEQEIVALTKAKLESCPWCGWSDLEVDKVVEKGFFQEIECKEHGKVSVLLPTENIEQQDFMDNLFCPFCK
jgi:hypothetical protein